MPRPARKASDDDFGALPLEEQLERLRRGMADQDPKSLLGLAAALRDPAPLAWLARALLDSGWFQPEDARGWFARFLVERPETAVQRVLQSLLAPPAAAASSAAAPVAVPAANADTEPSGAEGGALADLLLETLRRVPLARLASLCLVDRALKQHFPAAWERYVGDLVAWCTERLSAGRVGDITVELLSQVPGRDIAPLSAAAAAAGTPILAAFAALRRRLAYEAIAALGEAPKGISQANAEEILSRRVYTDPGHFLIELLQNAEDAGAITWRVVFERDRITVWHDGTPFDTRDLVGITSIGQTTKRKQQIGFFGVGFKSVFEVTGRPQVFSDVYDFEIVDVSIPKALARRPAGLPADGTLIVLPLRDPADRVRSPRALFEKARALDPCVLLTLRRIATIDLELTAKAGGPARHVIRETVSAGTGRSILGQEPDGWTRQYLISEEEYGYPHGGREAGRPDTTRVMVGVLVGPGGPEPLEAQAPTVYSYLPTAERSGLRFFVQGHFDVPVDRERISPESAWNRWILSLVPGLLARLAQRVAAEPCYQAGRAELARGLLEVLPLPDDCAAPLFRIVCAGLRAALADIPFLPGTDGRLHPPAATLTADADVAALFEGEAVEGTRYFLAPAAGPRAVQVVHTLGGAPFGGAELAALLERTLGQLPDGGRPTAAELPRRLRATDPAAFGVVYDLLLAEADRLEKAGNEAGEAARSAWLRRLRALPLLPDCAGGLHRAEAANGPCLARGDGALRAVYAGLRPFLHPALDAEPAPRRAGRSGRTALFLDRLGVPRLEVEHLVLDLEQALAGLPVPLPGPEAVRLPGSAARLARILEVLAGATVSLQRRALVLPLLPGADGRLYPAASGVGDRRGILSVAAGPADERLRAFYGNLRPLADPAAPPAVLALLERVGAPVLGIPTLVYDLESDPPLFPSDVARLGHLHALLESLCDDVPARTRNRLAALAIWPDRGGTARRLRGADAARIPADEDVVALLPGVPFLAGEVCARRHVGEMGAEVVDADAVVGALEPDAEPPLRIEPGPGAIAGVLAYLLAHGDRLRARSRQRLACLPVFLCDRGQVVALPGLCRAGSPALRALYGDFGGRHFVAPDGPTMAVLRRLDLEARLPTADVATLVNDLAALAPALDGKRVDGAGLPLIGGRGGLTAIHAFLAAETPNMVRGVLKKCADLAIYPDAEGRLGALGELTAHPARVHPCDPAARAVLAAAGVRLLDAAAQETLAPLVAAIGVPAAGLKAVVECLGALAPVAPGEPRPPLQADAILAQVQEYLAGRKDSLARRYPVSERADLPAASAVLCALPIWRTVGDAVLPADQVVEGDPLLSLLAAGTPERVELDRVRLAPRDRERFGLLAPLVVSRAAADVLAHWVERAAKAGEPLARQSLFLATIAAVRAVLGLLFAGAGAAGPTGGSRGSSALRRAICPLVDVRGHLRLDPLRVGDEDEYELLRGQPLAHELIDAELARALPLAAAERVKPLTAREVLGALNGPGGGAAARPARLADHPILCDPARRARFYRWLVTHEAKVFADAACRELLGESAVFPTDRGSLVCARALVADRDLPDLGIDWTPHKEIPAPVMDLLVRHLGIGRPDLEALAERHLLPAYRRAVSAGKAEEAGRLLRYLALRVGARPSPRMRALLAGDPPGTGLLLEDEDGRFLAPAALLLPGPDLEPHVRALWGKDLPQPSARRYPGELQPFLLALGVAAAPLLAQVRAAMERPWAGAEAACGLAAILRQLLRIHGQDLVDGLPLAAATWVADGNGSPRRPAELFLWAPEVEALVGSFPDLFPDARIPTLLGETLAAKVGFRTVADVQMVDVVRHIEARAAAGSYLPFRVYRWLEEGLAHGTLDARALVVRLGARRWVQADDGRFFPHGQVLGAQAFEYFGERRGYWTRGRDECPRLCAAFGIAAAVTAETVAAFLEEVAAEVARDGDRAALAREPALPRMLQSCYSFLGRAQKAVGRELPVVLARAPGDADRGLRLLAAKTPALLRSDTPTLEVLFQGAGAFWLAVRGSAEEREPVDRFHEAMGIRRLRDAYRVVVDRSSGRDCTAERTGHVQALRTVLRAVGEVVPRIRAQRAALDPAAWRDEKRLRPLSASGSIRAIEDLRVKYALQGVGEVKAETPAVYDLKRGELLVDVRVLAEGEGAPGGLAAALVPSIYEGAGEDTLIDLLEILLPLRTRERMDGYLDRRHFPAVEVQEGASDRLARRIGEMLDYGLDHKLEARFPALRGHDRGRWRDPEVVAALGAGTQEEAAGTAAEAGAARAAAALLDVAGVPQPPADLVAALTAILAAPSLGAIPADLFAPPERKAEPLLPPIQPAAPPARPPDAPFGKPMGVVTADAVAPAGTAGTAAMAQAAALRPARLAPSSGAAQRAGDAAPLPALPPAEASPAPVPGPAGVWDRLRGWLGFAPAAVASGPAGALPEWALAAANGFAPTRFIPPQLWATPAARQAVAAAPVAAALRFSPGKLPRPYLYAVHLAGGAFDPRTQSWTSEGAPAPARTTPGRATGCRVVFEGTLASGRSRLPLPLYGRLRGRPAVVEGAADLIEGAPEGGDLEVVARGSGPTRIRYEVDLLEVPPLTAGRVATAAPVLLRPTLGRDELPAEVRRYLAEPAHRSRSGWELAIAAQRFVLERYRYDEAFQTRPEVKRCLGRLRPGVGNHHLALLHAAGDGRVLGRGICYELNTMVVELLRHLGVPAAVATGWLLDEGVVDRPDHLFALALVPSVLGACLVPLDASVSEGGPVRPLGPRPAAAGGGGAPALPEAAVVQVLPVAQGPWAPASVAGREDAAAIDRHLAEMKESEGRRLRAEVELLGRALALIAAVARPPGASEAQALLAEGAPPTLERAAKLRAAAERLLPAPEVASALLGVLRGDYREVSAVPTPVQELVRLGLARIQTTPAYRVEAVAVGEGQAGRWKA